jgi:hypothetical protein
MPCRSASNCPELDQATKEALIQGAGIDPLNDDGTEPDPDTAIKMEILPNTDASQQGC